MIVMPNANAITIVIELSPTAVNPETLSSLAVALNPAPYTKALVRHSPALAPYHASSFSLTPRMH
jgi:hypothetical protein